MALSGLGEALLGLGKYDEADRVLHQSLQAMDQQSERATAIDT